MFQKIVVVCTGNICRSPMAEGLLRSALPDREVLSAGTFAMSGWPADDTAIELMQRYGIDITEHRAQQATQPLLTAMDLILTLDQTHSDWINRQYPQLRGRVHKLLRWRDNADVEDPYRLPRAVFERSFDDIERGVDDWLIRLK